MSLAERTLDMVMSIGCSASPDIATPSDGALRRHPHTLTALRTESGVEDASGERGLCVRSEDGGCGRSGAPLIWSSGSCGREAGGGQTDGSPPGEPAHRTAGMPTKVSHSYSHASR